MDNTKVSLHSLYMLSNSFSLQISNSSMECNKQNQLKNIFNKKIKFWVDKNREKLLVVSSTG
jgi:hypothetical protein